MGTVLIDDILTGIVELPIDKKKGNRMLISRRALGQRIFSSASNPTQLLVELINAADNFLADRKIIWFVDKDVGLPQLLIQAFCVWIVPVSDFADKNRRGKPKRLGKDNVGESGPVDGVRKAPPPPPPALSVEEKLIVVRAALKIPMKMESKTWTLIIRALHLKQAPLYEQFLVAVDESVANGTASFELLSICLHDKPFRTHFRPELLVQALLLGPLRGSTVEAFASERSAEFRAECRQMLLAAEATADKRDAWAAKVRELLHREPDTVADFNEFVKRVYSVMQELRAEPPDDDRIHKGWAFASLKKAATRYYDDALPYDMFHELVWTILAQRPEMKSSVLRMLTQDFRDPGEAQRWAAFNAYQVSPKQIPLLPALVVF